MHGNPGIKKPVFIMKLAGPWTLVFELRASRNARSSTQVGDLGKHAADPPPALAVLPERRTGSSSTCPAHWSGPRHGCPGRTSGRGAGTSSGL